MKFNKLAPLPSFRKGIKNTAGRNNSGHITIRHRGGGHKQSVRPITWQPKSDQGIVVGFDYDPQRTTSLVKLYHNKSTGNSSISYSYQIPTQNTKPLQKLNFGSEKLSQSGDSHSLSSFEPGDFMHSVEFYPGQGNRIARSAGSFCQMRSSFSGESSKFINSDASVRQTNRPKPTNSYIKIRLPSGSQRLISSTAKAVFGIPFFDKYHQQTRKKAGRNRWYGWRPSVRGVARNPVDHPHGGGQGKTSGGRPSVTFKAWPTKGQPTRSPKRKSPLIIVSRKKN